MRERAIAVGHDGYTTDTQLTLFWWWTSACNCYFVPNFFKTLRLSIRQRINYRNTVSNIFTKFGYGDSQASRIN